MKKAAIYLRVSTQEQALEGYSIQAQQERLKAYCLAKDYLIVEEYIDAGFSGSNLDRPAMQKLISDIDNIDFVIVYKLDRLSRSQKDTIMLIEDVFLQNNVHLISMQESFDTSTPFGRAMVGILSVFAQLERESIKERSMMGLRERAKEGLHHGGRMAPIGYEIDGDDLIINEAEAEQIRLIYALWIEGKSMASIARYMRESGYSHKYSNYRNTRTVANILTRAVYAGKIKYRNELYEGQHEPIISEETWNQAQLLIGNMRANQTKKSPSTDALLQGILFCGKCGAKMARRLSGTADSGRKYYECYSRHGHPAYMVKNPNCNNKIWKVKDLDALVEEHIFNMSLDAPKINPPDETKSLIKEIAKITKQIDRMMLLYQDDKIPISEVSSRIQILYTNKKSLEESLANKKSRQVGGKKAILDIKRKWDDSSAAERKAMLQSIVSRVTVDDENITVDFNF